MNTEELLEIHKHYLDYYLHEHKLSWEFIGIGWAANVGLLSALLLAFSLEQPRILLEIALCIIGFVSNVFLWISLERNEVYKNSLAYEGLKIEKELDQFGLSIRVFGTREEIREKGFYSAKRRKLLSWERWASTFAFRYSFLFLTIFWMLAGAYVYFLSF